MFQNRRLVIATKHQKEKVIAPLLEKELGVACFVPEDFDTDALGTFTGEIERKLDPIATVREKCLRAMDESGCDLGVASEGSFGPHPVMLLASADDEFLIFIDRRNNLEIIAREISPLTNFDGKEIRNERELMEFADQVRFPSHGLILRNSKRKGRLWPFPWQKMPASGPAMTSEAMRSSSSQSNSPGSGSIWPCSKVKAER